MPLCVVRLQLLPQEALMIASAYMYIYIDMSEREIKGEREKKERKNEEESKRASKEAKE